MGISARGILSPVRLPVSPLRHEKCFAFLLIDNSKYPPICQAFIPRVTGF